MTTASEATPVVARRIAVGVAAVLAIYLAFAETTVGQRFDDAAKLYAVTKHVHYQRLETLASLVAAAAGVMVLGAHLLWSRRSITAFGWTALGAVPPWLVAEIGKLTIPRRHLHPTPHWIGGPSFPSGHVAFTAGCVLTMVLLAPSHRRHAVAALATLTLMVSMTLVLTSGMHRPSDAYAAPVLALAWIAALAAFVTPSRPLWTSRTRGWWLVAGAVAVIGMSVGSGALRSATGGIQDLPAQRVIDQASYGAVLVALGVALAVGGAALEVLGAVSVPWSGRSPTSSDTAQTSGA